MKDYCVSCDQKKDGYYDDDPEMGTGWFHCFECAGRMEQAIQEDLQKDYDWYNSLNPEQQAEVKAEYRLSGVKDFPP